jgi:ribulose-phosphate 3-epimerase
MIKVAPSILSADFSKLGDEIGRVEKAGADWVHVDVMDGNFVPNITIGPGVVKAIRPYTRLPFDVHLMILRPENYIESFSKAGADLITIHLESSDEVGETLDRIRGLGKKPGVSLNPETPFDEVVPFIERIDLLLIMTVNPGFGGQSFMNEVVPKRWRSRWMEVSTQSLERLRSRLEHQSLMREAHYLELMTWPQRSPNGSSTDHTMYLAS